MTENNNNPVLPPGFENRSFQERGISHAGEVQKIVAPEQSSKNK